MRTFKMYDQWQCPKGTLTTWEIEPSQITSLDEENTTQIPLTPTQKMYAKFAIANNAKMHTALRFSIQGQLDINAFSETATELIKNSEILRSFLEQKQGEWIQYQINPEIVKVKPIETFEGEGEYLRKLTLRDADKFPAWGSLAINTLQMTDHFDVIIVMDHFYGDFTTGFLMTHNIQKAYSQILAGETPEVNWGESFASLAQTLTEFEEQFPPHSVEYQERLESLREVLEGEQILPAFLLEDEVKTSKAMVSTFQISNTEILDTLNKIAKENKVTMFSFLAAIHFWVQSEVFEVKTFSALTPRDIRYSLKKYVNTLGWLIDFPIIFGERQQSTSIIDIAHKINGQLDIYKKTPQVLTNSILTGEFPVEKLPVGSFNYVDVRSMLREEDYVTEPFHTYFVTQGAQQVAPMLVRDKDGIYVGIVHSDTKKTQEKVKQYVSALEESMEKIALSTLQIV